MRSKNEKICIVPIRYGLITWACLKICAAICIISYILVGAYYMFIQPCKPFNAFGLAMLVSEALLTMDISMSVLLIFGECKKNYVLVTAYFRYAVFAVVTAIIIILSYVTYELGLLWAHSEAPWQYFKNFSLSDVVILATIGTVYILIEVYFVYMLVKEMGSLRNQWQLKFKDDLSATESYEEA